MKLSDMSNTDQPNRKLVVDINQYLIDTYPTLPLLARNSIGAVCQQKDKIDFTAIHEQINVIAENYISKHKAERGYKGS